MKLNYLTIMVRDIEKSVAFYQELAELKVIREMNPGAGKIVFLANQEGQTMLELIQFDHADKVLIKGMVMSFEVKENLEEIREKAIVKGYSPSEIIEKGPKPKHFRVQDPDGIIVEFGI
ncbi:MAG: VOC family protein [Beduini sp.]|uniref:VOC family protein n=1 Tax=Beduini sp. TaxID=1922300 RepID=UPI0039A142C7